MKKLRSHLFLFTALIACLAVLHSCKKKNEEFPPRTWYEVTYNDKGIQLRDISAIFYENDHSLWLGSKGTGGVLYNDGYNWVEFNQGNTGIAIDSVTAITRDGNGKLWIGFKTGLATFDGNTWVNIQPLTGLRVTSVVVEGIGKIRVGIRGKSGGIATWLNSSWRIETPGNSTIPSGEINSLVSDNEQVLWAATADKGVVRLKNSLWENMSNGMPLLSQNFTSITKSPDGSIWAASDASQLIHFYADTYAILNTGTSKPISKIVVTAEANVWSSTLGSGLIRFDGNSWISYTHSNAYLPSDDIICLSESYPGYLVFSLPGGKVYMIKQ